MEAIILTSEQYNAMLTKMNQILAEVQNSKKNAKAEFMDNADFIQLMNISKRTAQSWRDKGAIPFVQIGAKIYYKASDVDAFLNQHYIQ
jgi:excisionase family DNA binding protein